MTSQVRNSDVVQQSHQLTSTEAPSVLSGGRKMSPSSPTIAPKTTELASQSSLSIGNDKNAAPSSLDPSQSSHSVATPSPKGLGTRQKIGKAFSSVFSGMKKLISSSKSAEERSSRTSTSENSVINRNSTSRSSISETRMSQNSVEISQTASLEISPKAAKLLGMKDSSLDLEKVLKECKTKSPIKDRFDHVVAPYLGSYIQSCKKNDENKVFETKYLLTAIAKYNEKPTDNRSSLELIRQNDLSSIKLGLMENFTKGLPNDQATIVKSALDQYTTALITNDQGKIDEAAMNLLVAIKESSPQSQELKDWANNLSNSNNQGLSPAQLKEVDTRIKTNKNEKDLKNLKVVTAKLDQLGIDYNPKISLNDALSLFATEAFKNNLNKVNEHFFDGDTTELIILYDTYKSMDITDQFVYFALSHISKQLETDQINAQFMSKTFDLLLEELEMQKKELDSGGGTFGTNVKDKGPSKEDKLLMIDDMIAQIKACQLISSEDLIENKEGLKEIFNALFIKCCKKGGYFQINAQSDKLTEFQDGMQKKETLFQTIEKFDDHVLKEAGKDSYKYQRMSFDQKLNFFESSKDII